MVPPTLRLTDFLLPPRPIETVWLPFLDAYFDYCLNLKFRFLIIILLVLDSYENNAFLFCSYFYRIYCSNCAIFYSASTRRASISFFCFMCYFTYFWAIKHVFYNYFDRTLYIYDYWVFYSNLSYSFNAYSRNTVTCFYKYVTLSFLLISF